MSSPAVRLPFSWLIFSHGKDDWAVGKYGVNVSYQLAPRAMIFRRDVDDVVDMESFEYIMRYNDYLNDPYALGNPYSAICSRGDLTSVNSTT